MSASHLLLRIIAVAVALGGALPDIAAQRASPKGQAEIILDQVADDVVEHYYDPALRGIDWKEKVREAKKKIENASSQNLAFANIAAMVDSLGDSHTFFIPPPHTFDLDYGWRIQAIGERCFVTRVRPETDAAIKVHPGDEVLRVNDYKPTRANIIRIAYVLNTLRPQSKITVVVRSVAGEEREVGIIPKVSKPRVFWSVSVPGAVEYKRIQPRLVSLNDNVLVAKIPKFMFDRGEASKLISEARKHKWVILDLRGTPGGQRDSLRLLIGGFFDHEVKIADAVTRKETKPILAKPNRDIFSGKLTVLVDSRSASAAEVFARVVQLEKRGVVMGDRTLGMVMEAHRFSHVSAETVFGVSVTIANLIMSDGNSLEHIGVTPDELVLPTVDDIVNDRDPVLAHAAEIAGATLSPADAAKLFPYEW